MESDLKEKGADVPSEEELSAIKSKMNGAIKQANDYVVSFKSELEAKEKEEEAKKEEELGTKDPKQRS